MFAEYHTAAPAVLATVDLSALPEDCVETLAAMGAVVRVVEVPPGSYALGTVVEAVTNRVRTYMKPLTPLMLTA